MKYVFSHFASEYLRDTGEVLLEIVVMLYIVS